MVCAETVAAAKNRDSAGRSIGFARTRTVLKIENQRAEAEGTSSRSSKGIRTEGGGKAQEEERTGVGPQGEEKEKVLDMAKKRRNTVRARGELCPQFFPFRLRLVRAGAAPQHAPQYNSYLFALKALTHKRRPSPLSGVKTAGAREVWKAPRRIAPRLNSRLPVRHWWA